MTVKICGITNLPDAQVAIEAGAQALGFNFWPRSPRYITPEDALEILNSLPREITRVGLFVNESPEVIEDVATRLDLDVVQLHGSSRAPQALRTWQALGVEPGFDPKSLDSYHAEAFVLDAPAGSAHGGAGITYDWRLVAGVDKKVVLAGGLEASNVAEAIRVAHPWGVDACSRLESEPGKKDHEKVKAFVKAALEASA